MREHNPIEFQTIVQGSRLASHIGHDASRLQFRPQRQPAFERRFQVKPNAINFALASSPNLHAAKPIFDSTSSTNSLSIISSPTL
jgi:hypothetical protein